jgi:acetyl esterase/lipase
MVFPSAKPNATTVILVHGGGWRKQTGLYLLHRQAEYLQAHGFAVFNINYRQDVGGPAFPTEPEDVVTATRYAISHASLYNANPSKVVYVAGSAGANIAALAAEQLDEVSPGTVKAVVSLSGPMNFETLVAMVKNHTIESRSLIVSIFMAMGGEESKAFEPAAWNSIPQSLERAGSPIFHIPARGCPDWLLFSSELDLVPLSQSQEMYSALNAAHCKATLQVLPGSGHGFYYWKKVASSIASFIAGE